MKRPAQNDVRKRKTNWEQRQPHEWKAFKLHEKSEDNKEPTVHPRKLDTGESGHLQHPQVTAQCLKDNHGDPAQQGTFHIPGARNKCYNFPHRLRAGRFYKLYIHARVNKLFFFNRKGQIVNPWSSACCTIWIAAMQAGCDSRQVSTEERKCVVRGSVRLSWYTAKFKLHVIFLWQKMVLF